MQLQAVGSHPAMVNTGSSGDVQQQDVASNLGATAFVAASATPVAASSHKYLRFKRMTPEDALSDGMLSLDGEMIKCLELCPARVQPLNLVLQEENSLKLSHARGQLLESVLPESYSRIGPCQRATFGINFFPYFIGGECVKCKLYI